MMGEEREVKKNDKGIIARESKEKEGKEALEL